MAEEPLDQAAGYWSLVFSSVFVVLHPDDLALGADLADRETVCPRTPDPSLQTEIEDEEVEFGVVAAGTCQMPQIDEFGVAQRTPL